MAPSTRRQCQQQKQWRWIINNSSTVDNQCEHKGGRQEEEEEEKVVDGNDEESTSPPSTTTKKKKLRFFVCVVVCASTTCKFSIYAKRLCLAPSFPRRRRRRSSSFSLFHLLFILFKSNLSLFLNNLQSMLLERLKARHKSTWHKRRKRRYSESNLVLPPKVIQCYIK